MKEFFSGKDGALGIAAEVIRDDGESSLPAMARMDEDSNREDKATAATVAIPNRFRCWFAKGDLNISKSILSKYSPWN